MAYPSTSDWLVDLQLTGIINETNTVFDAQHPYYWDYTSQYAWDVEMTPEEKATWYMREYFVPLANLVGYGRVWCGGTSGWCDGAIDENLQSRWVMAIVNEFIENNIGFTITPCFGTQENWLKNKQALFASNYCN